MTRVISFLLAFAFLLLVGCSNVSGTASKITPTPKTSSTADVNNKPASPEPTPSISSSSPVIPSESIPLTAAPSPSTNKTEGTTNQSATNEVDLALKAYKAVLENKSEFFSTENKKKVLFDDFLTNEEVFVTAFKPTRFAILDMDGDRIPEAVVELLPGSPDFFEVLHFSKGEVQGYIYSIRQLGDLKADGTFGWSGAASYYGYGKLNFDLDDEFKTDRIAYLDAEVINNVVTKKFIIDNKPVTEEAFNAYTKKQDEKPDATWHKFSQRNIDEQLTYDDNLCLTTENVLISFKIENSSKSASVCISKNENPYIIYRFGTKDSIEFEYPVSLEKSWDKFIYSYYLRGGGAGNAGLDLNYLSFSNAGFEYKIYQEYDAVSNETTVGIRVTNLSSGKVTDIKGDISSRTGSLLDLRYNKNIKING